MRDGDRVAVCHPEFLEDLRHWVETDRRTAKRLLELVRPILQDPHDGIGKPEPLKYLGLEVWSRRITQEHRCVYLVKPERLSFSWVATTTEGRLRPLHQMRKSMRTTIDIEPDVLSAAQESTLRKTAAPPVRCARAGLRDR